MKRKLILLAHSIAFTDETGVIYINKHLQKYSENLYKRILKHERGHVMGLYNKRDFLLDWKNDISQWELFKFCIAHPLGFIQLCPVVKVKDVYFYSWLSALKLIITIGTIWLIIKII